MKPAHLVAIGLLVVMAAVQTLRLLLQWDVNVNGVAIPPWVSVIALIVVLSAAIALWREARRLASSRAVP
jgi:hypothetical protein